MLAQKVAVIKAFDKGQSSREIAKQFDCGHTQIQTIIKDCTSILSEWEQGTTRADIKYIKHRRTEYQDLNQLVFDWFTTARSNNLPVSGPHLQEKALMLAAEMNHDDFTASNGWLHAFCRRHNIHFQTLSGESADVCPQTVDDWTKRLPDLTADYAPEDVFNADEMGLYFRALPQGSLVVKGDPSRGTKTSKDRITVLLACSSSGEKLTPLVIGKSKRPRCFPKNFTSSTLPVHYHHNKKAWMTCSIFQSWLERLNTKMKADNRKILLFIDNCSAHPP